ncbi:hypothetical protein D3C72_1548810 [compost metagenome]
MAKVSTANCGQHIRPMAAAARQTRASRRGEGAVRRPVAGKPWPAWAGWADWAGPADRAGWRGWAEAGSCSQQAASSAATAHIRASTPNTAAKPACAASQGSSSAPRPPPKGTAVWRMLMARPRSPSSNQAITARPLAPLTLPPSTPTSTRPTANSHRLGTVTPSGEAKPLIQASAAAVAPRPVNSTGRSPQRSVSRPQGSSNRATPKPIKPSAKPN